MKSLSQFIAESKSTGEYIKAAGFKPMNGGDYVYSAQFKYPTGDSDEDDVILYEIDGTDYVIFMDPILSAKGVSIAKKPKSIEDGTEIDIVWGIINFKDIPILRQLVFDLFGSGDKSEKYTLFEFGKRSVEDFKKEIDKIIKSLK